MANEQQFGIIFQAKDEATETIKKVSGSVDGFKKNVESLQPAFKTMAAAGTAVFAGLTLVVKDSLDAAGEAAKVQSQLTAVLKSTGGAAGVTADQAIKLSKALQTQSTFGDEAILSAENMLLTFTNIKDNIFPDATRTVLDMATALGVDAKDASIQLGKALNDPILGVTALRRVGVSFTQEQQDMIKSLVESGHLLDAQKMVLAELGKEFGGSALEQTKNFAGQMQMLKEQVGDFKEAIGVALIPVIDQLTQRIVPLVSKFTEWAETHPELIRRIIGAIAAVSGLAIVLGTIGIVLPAVITGLTLLFSPVGLVLAAFTALAAGVAYAIVNWDTFKVTLNNAVATIDEHTGLITYMRTTFEDLALMWQQNVMPALRELWEAFQPFKPFFDALITVIGAGLVGALTLLVQSLKVGIGTIMVAVEWSAKFLAVIMDLVSWISGKFTDALAAAMPIVEKMVGWMKQLVEYATQAVNAISNVASKAAGSVLNAGSSVVSSVKSAIGVKDAIITPGGQVIQTDPMDYLIATKTPGALAGAGVGNITVNINGGNYLSQDAARMMGDELVRQLKTALKI